MIQGNDIAANVANGIFLNAVGGRIGGLLIGGVAATNGNTVRENGSAASDSAASNGIATSAGSLAGTTLAGNTIRANGNHTTHVGAGIRVLGSDLMIGWDADPATAATVGNTITDNALDGIRISGPTAVRNTILSNSIYLNGYVAADLVVGKGISLADGGNAGQVAPQILDVVSDNADVNDKVVNVQFRVPAAGSYVVQFFSNTGDNNTTTEDQDDDRGLFPVDVNGFAGRTFVGERPLSVLAQVTTGKPVIQPIGGSQVVTGDTLQTIAIPAALLPAGSWLTATATLIDGTTPTNTSPFSPGVQVTAAPVLAAGADGQSLTWNREYTFQVKTATSIAVTGLTAGELATLSAKNALTRTPLVLTVDGRNVAGTVSAAGAAQGRLTIALDLAGESLPAGGRGTMVLGSPSLPAAGLYDASNASLNAILSIGASDIEAALCLDATTNKINPALDKRSLQTSDSKVSSTLTPEQVKNFVNRFQGGLRTTSADFDGDGSIDLVTAPGGMPAKAGSFVPGTAANAGVPRQTLADGFGAAARVITIYNGNASGGWSSASLDVSREFPNECGGFLVTVGNVRAEAAGSHSAVAELIVASTSKVRIYEVRVSSRGAAPTFANADGNAEIRPAGSVDITGLTAGDLSDAATDDIVVAMTTSKINSRNSLLNRYVTDPTAANTAKIDVYRGGAAGSPKSFFIDSRVENGDPTRGGKLQNAFYFGANLAVGDIDNLPDQRPELVLAAREGGLGNFRVLPAELVVGGDQRSIDTALSPAGVFSAAPRTANTAAGPGATRWQPKGGPDYFLGYGNVPTPVGRGFNAPLSVAVVEANGRNFRAEVFAALGVGNQTPNTIRQLGFLPDTRGAGDTPAARGAWSVANATAAFLVPPGGTQLTLTGDQRAWLQANRTVSIAAAAGRAEVTRRVTAVEFRDGNTLVTLAERIDGTATGGTLVGDWLSVPGRTSGVGAAVTTRFALGGGIRLG